jgi:hypothetical protein
MAAAVLGIYIFCSENTLEEEDEGTSLSCSSISCTVGVLILYCRLYTQGKFHAKNLRTQNCA